MFCLQVDNLTLWMRCSVPARVQVRFCSGRHRVECMRHNARIQRNSTWCHVDDLSYWRLSQSLTTMNMMWWTRHDTIWCSCWKLLKNWSERHEIHKSCGFHAVLISSEFSMYHVQVALYRCTVDIISDRDQCNAVKAIKKDRFGFSAHTSKMVTIGNHNSQATSCRTVSYNCDTGTKTRLGSSAWPSNRFSGTFRGCLWQVEVVNCCWPCHDLVLKIQSLQLIYTFIVLFPFIVLL